jgi:hypothetical protein
VKVAEAIAEVAETIERKRADVPALEFLRQVVDQTKQWQKRGPQDRVLARGIIARKELEQAEGGSLSTVEVAKTLGYTNRQSVDYQRVAQNLVAWRISTHWRYPKWQFTKNGLLPGIKECLHTLNTKSCWARMAFFLSKRHSLGGKRPLDMLREGRVDEAIAAARREGGHGPQ